MPPGAAGRRTDRLSPGGGAVQRVSGAPRGPGGPTPGTGRGGAGRCGGGSEAEGGGPLAQPLAGPASPPSFSASSRRPPVPGGWSRADGGLRVALARRAGVRGQGGWSWGFGGVPGGGRLDQDRSKLTGEGARSAAKFLAGGRDGHAVAGVRHPPLVECVRRGVRRSCPPGRPPRLPGPSSSSPSPPSLRVFRLFHPPSPPPAWLFQQCWVS